MAELTQRYAHCDAGNPSIYLGRVLWCSRIVMVILQRKVRHQLFRLFGDSVVSTECFARGLCWPRTILVGPGP